MERTLEVLGVLLVDKGGKVTAIIQDHVEGLAAGECSKCLLNTPVVLLLSLALPREDGDASCSNTGPKVSGDSREKWKNHVRRCGVVLSGEDVLGDKREVRPRSVPDKYCSLTQDDHVTSAPSTTKVSISTAVWMVLQMCQYTREMTDYAIYMCRQPAMRAPLRGLETPYYHYNQ